MNALLVFGVVIFAIALAVWMAREGQREKDELHEAEDKFDAAVRVAQAEANAPRTADDLIDRLRDPGRGL